MKTRSTAYQLNPTCNRCKLHETAESKSICLRGRNATERKALVVFTDYPDYFSDHSGRGYTLDTKNMLDWMFRRMSVDPNDVAYEYTLRCYPAKTLPTTKAARSALIEECSSYRFATIRRIKPRAIAGLGQTTLEAFTGKTRIGDYEGRRLFIWEGVVRDFVGNIWVGYSLNYILMSPSDTANVFRVLYRAAEEAGLNPKLDSSVPPFKWRIIK